MDKLDQNINSNPNTNYKVLIAETGNAHEKHFPCKLVIYNKYEHKKSTWITQGIVRSIKTRDRLYKKLKMEDRNLPEYVTLKINLTSYNNILKSCIRSAKQIHYTHIFIEFKNDTGKPWTTIQEI